ncbi:hypothetical protein FVEN_g12615 [Fusarium venenatum]|uniref:Uncharacterized protein n=1 Tax=Fusarium venenatum TaxID=56646 RepID=A0A2L2TFI8_9HYPO|nr:uncharacterized protein FVRRES_07613 [Fusarium venenatum]KAG8362032.1 hypothetical protein FVEN_g12615 [Fusarium venenatum]CEI63177.1 unnamed protein product [Fusarium venenatum]
MDGHAVIGELAFAENKDCSKCTDLRVIDAYETSSYRSLINAAFVIIIRDQNLEDNSSSAWR